MAGIVTAKGVDNAYHRPVEGIITIARGLDEGFAQEQGEFLVAVTGKRLRMPVLSATEPPQSDVSVYMSYADSHGQIDSST